MRAGSEFSISHDEAGRGQGILSGLGPVAMEISDQLLTHGWYAFIEWRSGGLSLISAREAGQLRGSRQRWWLWLLFE